MNEVGPRDKNNVPPPLFLSECSCRHLICYFFPYTCVVFIVFVRHFLWHVLVAFCDVVVAWSRRGQPRTQLCWLPSRPQAGLPLCRAAKVSYHTIQHNSPNFNASSLHIPWASPNSFLLTLHCYTADPGNVATTNINSDCPGLERMQITRTNAVAWLFSCLVNHEGVLWCKRPVAPAIPKAQSVYRGICINCLSPPPVTPSNPPNYRASCLTRIPLDI